jgi:hypothetical protein
VINRKNEGSNLAVISGVGVEITWALLTLVYGILVEKYYVSMWSAIPNLAGFFIMLATIDLPSQAFVLLGFYTFVGLYIVYRRETKLYAIVGSKAYGSLMLVLGLNQFSLLDGMAVWAQANVNSWFGTDTGKIVFSWFVVVCVSQILSWALANQVNLTRTLRHGL